MAEDDDGMDGVNEASGGKKKICKRCRKEFTPPGQGNYLYCSEVCRMIINSKPRSSSISSNSEKRKRSNSVDTPVSFDDMTREDLIILIKELSEEKETLNQDKDSLINHTKELENELVSIKLKIADKFLDKFFNSDQTHKALSGSGAVSQKGKSYAAAAAKSVTIVAKLDPQVDTSNMNDEAMDKFFKSNSDYPTLQSFSKKENVARFKFNNQADANKAKKLLETDSAIKATVKSVTERKLEYPIAVFGTGVENLEVLKKEMEFRNEVLRGNISRIKPLSKKKGHVKIYVTSKKCEEEVIQAGTISIKHTTGNFKDHRVDKVRLDFEVTYCFNCKKQGHVAFKCPEKTETCGRCAESHKTTDCTHPDTKVKCVNCNSVKHKSGDFKCPVHIKAVDRLRILLA